MKNLGVICLLLITIFYMITRSKQVIESVCFSISIWKDNLFPTLFPFFVVSNLLMHYGFVDIIGTFLQKPMRHFFKLPGCCGFVLASSLFSGFPSGAKYTKDLVEQNKISKQEAERLLTFTHYSNPLFVLGMIGTILLANQKIAFLILISHITAGILVGIIFNHKKEFSEKEKKTIPQDQQHQNTKTFGELLTTSIWDSLNTMFLLLGIVTIFLIFNSLIQDFTHFPNILQAILAGLLEMTQGVKLVSSLEISLLLKAILITGVISFGGFSVHMQVLGIISSNQIKYKSFFLARILHAILAMGLVLLLFFFFSTY